MEVEIPLLILKARGRKAPRFVLRKTCSAKVRYVWAADYMIMTVKKLANCTISRLCIRREKGSPDPFICNKNILFSFYMLIVKASLFLQSPHRRKKARLAFKHICVCLSLILSIHLSIYLAIHLLITPPLLLINRNFA